VAHSNPSLANVRLMAHPPIREASRRYKNEY